MKKTILFCVFSFILSSVSIGQCIMIKPVHENFYHRMPNLFHFEYDTATYKFDTAYCNSDNFYLKFDEKYTFLESKQIGEVVIHWRLQHLKDSSILELCQKFIVKKFPPPDLFLDDYLPGDSISLDSISEFKAFHLKALIVTSLPFYFKSLNAILINQDSTSNVYFYENYKEHSFEEFKKWAILNTKKNSVLLLYNIKLKIFGFEISLMPIEFKFY
jgi:hypothetical protein